mmetsp:Transcript_823/g.1902  ORF Transcript_823/g.1902 Transcript_823/m.1902 type:complete len:232 (-) Transcript_823:365-1060(-)
MLLEGNLVEILLVGDERREQWRVLLERAHESRRCETFVAARVGHEEHLLVERRRHGEQLGGVAQKLDVGVHVQASEVVKNLKLHQIANHGKHVLARIVVVSKRPADGAVCVRKVLLRDVLAPPKLQLPTRLVQQLLVAVQKHPLDVGQLGAQPNDVPHRLHLQRHPTPQRRCRRRPAPQPPPGVGICEHDDSRERERRRRRGARESRHTPPFVAWRPPMRITFAEFPLIAK